MNYQNGKIYKIVSNQSEEVYIGSTAQVLLCQRFGQHMNEYKRYLSGKIKPKTSSVNIIQYNDAHIVLIEVYPCHSKEELVRREQYHMDLHKDLAVNKLRAVGLDGKEYYELNKDKKKEYYEANKDKKKEYYEANKVYIKAQKKEYYEANKD